ncbi:MAG: TIR domain-containing protein [Candidatus Zixiibacteriota bacterium]
MFIGAHKIAIARNGNFRLPNAIWQELTEKGEKCLVITRGFDDCIFIYPESNWIAVEEKLKDMDHSNKVELRLLCRYIISNSCDITIGKDGLVCIPEILYSWASMGKDALLLGLVDRLELWRIDRFESLAIKKKEHTKDPVRIEIKELFGEQSNDAKKLLRGMYAVSFFTHLLDRKAHRHLFICYSSKDKSFAQKLALDLTNNGITVWLDQWEMLPGDSLYEKIQSGIRDSSWFAIILTPHSVNSKWCKRELHQALEEEFQRKGVYVIPVLRCDCTIPGFLKEKVYVDMRSSKYRDGLDYLLKRF